MKLEFKLKFIFIIFLNNLIKTILQKENNFIKIKI